jgi:hypothetical protein
MSNSRGRKPVTDAVVDTASADEAALHSIAAAIRDAAATASVSEHAAAARQSVSEAGPKALEAISNTVYTGSYALAYGVVYAATFVFQSLPQENPLVRGLRDGGRAAIDQAGEV